MEKAAVSAARSPVLWFLVQADLFEQVPVPYHELDIEGRVRRVNRAECELLGYEGPSSILGKYAWDLVSPDAREAAKAAVHRKLAGLEPLRPFRRNFQTVDGRELVLEIHESLVFDAADKITGIRSILIDCTRLEAEHAALENQVALRTADLTQALEQLRGREESFRLLFASHPHPMWVYDKKTLLFLEVNEAALQQYGYSREEFLKMRITAIRPASEIPRLNEYLQLHAGNVRDAGDWHHARKDGSLLDVRISSHAIEFNDRPAMLTLAIDITEQKLLEQQFRQSQKMEAIGRLAGGVAHDFNNLLTIIIGYGSVLMEETEGTSSTHSAVCQMLLAADRAAVLTKQLLAFSRQQTLELRLIDLNQVVLGIHELARCLISENMVIHTELKPAIGRVKADPNQIEQVILNLLVNARDAMQGGGKVTIATGEADLGDEHVATHEGARAGPHVFFAVSDTGVGMDPHTQAKIFEPFFTTKELGKGTGLGLSTAYGIVRQHNGSISVHSVPNEGTTFTIYLPAVVPGAGRDGMEAVSLTRHDLLECDETILIVEDDSDVRAICARVLERLGYRVIVAENGMQALERCGEYAGNIDLLITDIVMPGIDGRELAAQVEALRPGTKTLFCSGYSGPAVVNRKTLLQQDAFLQKPYTPHALAKAVREVLAQ